MKRNYVGIVWGVCIIALGIILLGNLFGWFSINVFFNGWWTLFIIVPSIIGLIHKGNKSPSIIFLLVGLGLLAAEQNLITYDIFGQALVAAIILIIGINILIGGFRRKNRPNFPNQEDIGNINNDVPPETSPNVDEIPGHYYQFNAVFSGNEKIFDRVKFSGAKMSAVFGGVDLDLRQAIIDKDVYIDVTAVFGGVDIILPTNVNCVVKGTSIFGGTDNKVPQRDTVLPTVYVNSVALFGGVDIR